MTHYSGVLGGPTAAVEIPAALAMTGIDIAYPRQGDEDLVIVERYGLSLEAGRIHCLAGRSGSGKTSVLRVAAGLVRPDSGEVSWAGTALSPLSDDAVTVLRRQKVGYLDQGGVLVEGLTALENVLLPAVPGRRTRELAARALDLLEKLGVDGRASHYPDRVSGGERQRIALARALLLEPELVMADEPTANLDRRSADSVIGVLQDLAESGIAVLVASHDPHLIEAADTRTTLA